MVSWLFGWLSVYILRKERLDFYRYLSTLLPNPLYCLWRSIIFLDLMADNIWRALQDINLGAGDAPFVLPPAVVRQAEEERRFILIGHLVMPHKQNLRAIVTSMQRNWGFQSLVRGRVIEGR